jgi:hypothetical protein
MKKNIQESLRLQDAIHARKALCYINAINVVLYVAGYGRATYVEGLAVDEDKCYKHGWVERNSEILDPTLPVKKMGYFPGLKFEGKKGIEDAMCLPVAETGEYLPLLYGFGNCPEFRRAWERAVAFAASTRRSVTSRAVCPFHQASDS